MIIAKKGRKWINKKSKEEVTIIAANDIHVSYKSLFTSFAGSDAASFYKNFEPKDSQMDLFEETGL